jgi:hypothetical protein
VRGLSSRTNASQRQRSAHGDSYQGLFSFLLRLAYLGSEARELALTSPIKSECNPKIDTVTTDSVCTFTYCK